MGQHKKKGGAPLDRRECALFADRIDRCRLLDAGATGSKYTWRGRIFNGCRTFQRLDRALCNDYWQVSYLEAIVKVLPRVEFSDHHPLLVCLHGLGGAAIENARFG